MYIQCRRRTLPEFKAGAQPYKPRPVKVIKRKDLLVQEQHHTCEQSVVESPMVIEKTEVPAWLKESLKNLHSR